MYCTWWYLSHLPASSSLHDVVAPLPAGEIQLLAVESVIVLHLPDIESSGNVSQLFVQKQKQVRAGYEQAWAHLEKVKSPFSWGLKHITLPYFALRVWKAWPNLLRSESLAYSKRFRPSNMLPVPETPGGQNLSTKIWDYSSEPYRA